MSWIAKAASRLSVSCNFSFTFDRMMERKDPKDIEWQCCFLCRAALVYKSEIKKLVGNGLHLCGAFSSTVPHPEAFYNGLIYTLMGLRCTALPILEINAKIVQKLWGLKHTLATMPNQAAEDDRPQAIEWHLLSGKGSCCCCCCWLCCM